ncbi:MAG TPA: response regulator [Candidatus Methylomirabilis sp.]|nr:response regulator [Candidatus Methylomirabilis sp.]
MDLAASKPWRVLVIESDPRELELLTAYLGAAGYVVRGAETGALAQRQATKEPPDLILLDLHLPDMDGDELCRVLREDSQTSRIPVVIVTEGEGFAHHRQAYAAGAQAFIPKPVRRPALVATIEAVLAGARPKKVASVARKEGAGQATPISGVRQFERFAISLPAVGWAAQYPGKVIEGVVKDISAGGFMAELSVRVALGNTVDLVLDTQLGALELKGRVVWNAVSGQPGRHGLAFSNPKSTEFVATLRDAEGQ